MRLRLQEVDALRDVRTRTEGQVLGVPPMEANGGFEGEQFLGLLRRQPGGALGGGGGNTFNIYALDGRAAAEAVVSAMRDAKRYGLTGVSI